TRRSAPSASQFVAEGQMLLVGVVVPRDGVTRQWRLSGYCVPRQILSRRSILLRHSEPFATGPDDRHHRCSRPETWPACPAAPCCALSGRGGAVRAGIVRPSPIACAGQ